MHMCNHRVYCTPSLFQRINGDDPRGLKSLFHSVPRSSSRSRNNRTSLNRSPLMRANRRHIISQIPKSEDRRGMGIPQHIQVRLCTLRWPPVSLSLINHLPWCHSGRPLPFPEKGIFKIVEWGRSSASVCHQMVHVVQPYSFSSPNIGQGKRNQHHCHHHHRCRRPSPISSAAVLHAVSISLELEHPFHRMSETWGNETSCLVHVFSVHRSVHANACWGHHNLLKHVISDTKGELWLALNSNQKERVLGVTHDV